MKRPMCEVCGKKPATAFVLLSSTVPGKREDVWKYACDCTSKTEAYYVEIEHAFRSPEEVVDTLAHLHEKSWMDWNDFANAVTRYRNKQRGFGSRSWRDVTKDTE